MAKSKSPKFERFKANLYLKASLLRIWFVKNLKTFILLAVVIYAIVILTGNATGGLIFGSLSSAIADATSAETWSDIIMNCLAVVLSLASGFFAVFRKTKKITLQDIKSKKLKLAMIAAGLYFDSNGKLTKQANQLKKSKVKKTGEVEEVKDEPAPSELNIIRNTINSVSELGTILTTHIEAQPDYIDIINATEVNEDKILNEDEEKEIDLLNNNLINEPTEEEKQKIIQIEDQVIADNVDKALQGKVKSHKIRKTIVKIAIAIKNKIKNFFIARKERKESLKKQQEYEDMEATKAKDLPITVEEAIEAADTISIKDLEPVEEIDKDETVEVVVNTETNITENPETETVHIEAPVAKTSKTTETQKTQTSHKTKVETDAQRRNKATIERINRLYKK